MWLSLLVTTALVPEMLAETRRPAEVIDLVEAAARRPVAVAAVTTAAADPAAVGSAAHVVRLATS